MKNLNQEKEELGFDHDKKFFAELEKRGKQNLIKDLKNKEIGKQIKDFNSYIKKPNRLKIFFRKIGDFLNRL